MSPKDIINLFKTWLDKAKELDKQTGGKYHYFENLKKDLMAAGIMDKSGNIKGDIDSYIQGSSFLHTRAISSMASMAAGGMNLSGTLGGDKPSIKVDAMSSLKGGDNSVIYDTHSQRKWGNIDVSKKVLEDLNNKLHLGLSKDDINKLAPQLASNEELIHSLKVGDYGKALVMLGLQKTLGLNDVDRAVTTLVGGGIVTGAAIDKLRHAINGDRVATEDMTIKDKYGREMKIAKGDTFNIKDIDPQERIKALEHSKVEESFAGKVAGKVLHKTKDGFRGGINKLFGSTGVNDIPNTQNDTFNSTDNSSHNGNNAHTNQTSPDNPYGSSPSSFSSSINDEGKNVNTFEDFDRKLLQNEIESKTRLRNPEKIKARDNILKALANNEPVNREWLNTLGYSNKAIDTKFGDLIENENILSKEDYTKYLIDKNLVNKVPKGITTLGKFAIENLIDGTPLNPTSLANDSLYSGKFKGFAPDDDWFTPKEALVRVGNNAFETNVNFDALNNWMQANPKKAQMLQSALNHQTYISPVDLENISTPNGLFNYVMSHTKMTEISPTAATALHQPTAGADYHTSVANQVQAIQLQQRLVQDQEYMRQFINPVNPAYGVTLQTASGELSLASTPRGTLEIGGYHTKIFEFRSFINFIIRLMKALRL